MYQMRSMGLESSSVWAFWNPMFCLRREGREPGRLASSIRSCSRRSTDRRLFRVAGLTGWVGTKVGAMGWDMLFCPMIIVPECEIMLGFVYDG